jgi:hypothetical protein
MTPHGGSPSASLLRTEKTAMAQQEGNLRSSMTSLSQQDQGKDMENENK